MHLLLLTAYFPPDTGSAAHLFADLGRTFVGLGHDVTVVTGFPSYHAQGDLDRYRGRKSLTENVDGMTVLRIRVGEVARNTPIGRGLWQFNCARAFRKAADGARRADITLVYSPPLPLALAALGLRRRRGTPCILNVQDLFPQSAIDLGLMRNRLLIRMFRALESRIYRRVDGITVHSRGNQDYVVARGGSPSSTVVVHNSVDTDQIRPGNRMNELRRELGLDGRFVASFGGIMGFSQDLDVILDAAKRMKGKLEMAFLLAGEGVEKDRLVARSREQGLDNVIWLPMLPRERYPLLLEASDVCLTTLHADVKTPVVPSKILSAMAAGRPVIAALDPNGDAPALIQQAAAGISIPPEDAEALAAALIELAENPELGGRMGNSGRQFAEEHLAPEKVARGYETFMNQVLGVS